MIVPAMVVLSFLAALSRGQPQKEPAGTIMRFWQPQVYQTINQPLYLYQADFFTPDDAKNRLITALGPAEFISTRKNNAPHNTTVQTAAPVGVFDNQNTNNTTIKHFGHDNCIFMQKSAKVSAQKEPNSGCLSSRHHWVIHNSPKRSSEQKTLKSG